MTAQPARERAELLDSGTARDTLSVLFQMSRPRTLPQSVLLLLLGAYGAERNLNLLTIASPVRRELCLPGVLVALTTGASMLVNDYFDFQNGNDQTGPLVQGRVRSRTVKAPVSGFTACTSSSPSSCTHPSRASSFLPTRSRRCSTRAT